MPELPSVERGRRLLEDYLVNKKIIDVNANESGGGPRDGLFDDIVFKNAKDGILPKDIVKTLKGKIVTASKRKGKYLWISLKDDNTTTTNNNNNNNNRKKRGKITTLIADMSDLRSTRDATIKYAESNNSTLDMLFLNAGIASAGKNEDGGLKLSVDGIEKVFATNHVGHHLMWKILESKVKSSNCGRVVLTSSATNFGSYDYGIATDLETLNAGEANMKAYGQSKLAQVLWAQELTRRLGPDSNVYVNSYHPGAAATMIWFTNPMIPKFMHPILRFFTENVMWTSLEGALTMLYLGAASEDLVTNNVRGKYFHPQVQEVIPNPKFAQNLQLQKDLWTFSDELIERA